MWNLSPPVHFSLREMVLHLSSLLLWFEVDPCVTAKMFKKIVANKKVICLSTLCVIDPWKAVIIKKHIITVRTRLNVTTCLYVPIQIAANNRARSLSTPIAG